MEMERDLTERSHTTQKRAAQTPQWRPEERTPDPEIGFIYSFILLYSFLRGFLYSFTESPGAILTFDIAASARTRCMAAASPPSSAPELMKSTIGSGGSAQKQKIAFIHCRNTCARFNICLFKIEHKALDIADLTKLLSLFLLLYSFNYSPTD